MFEDGTSATVSLEDGGRGAALGGGFGQRLRIAVAALGGGCGRRTCNDGIGISVIEAEGYCHNIGISIGKDGERGCIRCKGPMLAAMSIARWWGWQRYGYNDGIDKVRARG